MLTTAYCLIRPKHALLKKLAECTCQDAEEYLREPFFWTMEHIDRCGWKFQHYLGAVKCVWLAEIKYEILNKEELGQIFGTLPIETQTFDSWWELEWYNGPGDPIEGIAKDLWEYPAAIDELTTIDNPALRALLPHKNTQDNEGQE